MASSRDILPAILLAGLLACVSATAQKYTIVDLGALDLAQGNSVALGMNSAGDVVGYAFEARGGYWKHAFVYSHRQQREIRVECYNPRAAGINDSGDIIVQCVAGSREASFVVRDDKVVPQIVLRRQLQFRAINNSGEVVGNYYGEYPSPDCSCFRAVHWKQFIFSDLPALGGRYKEFGDANATAINDAGQVVGEASASHMWSPRHAVIWAADGIHDLGTLGGRASNATGINASGQVVGTAETGAHERHAFLYGDGVMKDLGALGGDSEASAINASGQIVGKSRIEKKAQHFWNAPPASRAFLYQNGVMTDLNSLVTGPLAGSITLQEAPAINDSGLIAATGLDRRTGATRAYLLVPEPKQVP
jgi:probable HAF family extracellular repeat protein